MLYAIGNTLVNVLLALVVLMALVSMGFGIGVLARGRWRHRKDGDLGRWLARELGGDCFHGTWPGLEEFREGLVDFGPGEGSVDFVVRVGKDGVDAILLGGRGGSGETVWLGCIVKAGCTFPVSMVVFNGRGEDCLGLNHRGIPPAWERIEVESGPLKGYTLASPRGKEALEILERGLDRVLARVSRTVEGSVLPDCLVLQVVGERVALYVYEGDMAGLDQYMAMYRGALGVATSLVGEFKCAQMETSISRASFS